MNKKIIAFGLACAFAVSMAAPSAGAVTDEQYQALVDQLADLTALYNTLLAQTSAPAASATAVCFDADLQQGMTSDSVKDLQIKLGVTPTSGYFGPITLAAVKTFQTANGVINTGYVGPLTRGVLNALYCTPVTPVTYPAGCTSAVGFSITTGLSCSGAVTYPAGCTSAVGFSPTTGLPCSEVTTLPEGCTSAVGFSPTTGLSCAGTTTVAPAYGSLSVVNYPVSNPVTTVYGGQTYGLVSGQYKATGSDMTIRKVAVKTTSGSADVFPWQAFSAISVWDGSTMLAELPVTQANAIQTTFASIYTFDVSGLNVVVAKDTQKVLTVKATVVSGVTATISGKTFTFTLLGDTGIVCSDTAGVTYTSVTGGNLNSQSVAISAAQIASFTVTAAADNPLAGNVVGSISATTRAEVLKFNVRNNTDISAIFNSGTITATSTNATTTVSVELWDGTTQVAAAAPAASGAVAWSSFTLPIAANTMKTLTVKAVIVQLASGYAGGDTVTISTGPVLSGIDSNSNVASADGSTVTGNAQSIYLSGPIFTLVSAAFPSTGDTSHPQSTGNAKIVFSVTAAGTNDVYLGSVDSATSTITPAPDSASSSVANGFTCTSGVTSATNGFRITAGNTATCELNTTVQLTGTYDGAYYQVAVKQVTWGIADNSYTNTHLVGWNDFKTGQTYLAY